jgi:hypothetical protein
MTARGKQPKQRQHRLKHRAAHGSPIYSKRVAAWVTPGQRQEFERRGGSEWLRRVLDVAIFHDIR